MDSDTPAHRRGPGAFRLLFSSHEEFLSELRERGPNLEPVVRATIRRTPDASGAPFVHLTLVATYLRRVDEAGPRAVVAVVQLAEHVGALWPGLSDEESRESRERAEELAATVAREAEQLGYRAGAGVYSAAGSGDASAG